MSKQRDEQFASTESAERQAPFFVRLMKTVHVERRGHDEPATEGPRGFRVLSSVKAGGSPNKWPPWTA